MVGYTGVLLVSLSLSLLSMVGVPYSSTSSLLHGPIVREAVMRAWELKRAELRVEGVMLGKADPWGRQRVAAGNVRLFLGDLVGVVKGMVDVKEGVSKEWLQG
jgi:hypothetical protein